MIAAQFTVQLPLELLLDHEKCPAVVARHSYRILSLLDG